MAAGGVAPAHLALGEAVEAEQGVVGAEGVERRLRHLGPRLDEARVVVEGAQRLERRDVPDPARLRVGLRERRAGGRGRVLREESEHEHPLDVRGRQARETLADRGPPVAHRELDPVAVPQRLRDRVAQGAAVHEQGRALGRPDAAVRRRGAPRAEGQDHEVQERPAGRRRDVDHARVGEELAQVAPHVAGLRRVRRAEVDQEDADRALGLAHGGGSRDDPPGPAPPRERRPRDAVPH